MRVTVLVRFQDKVTGNHYSEGQTINVEGNRFHELIEAGVVKAEEEEAEYVAEPLRKPIKKNSNKR